MLSTGRPSQNGIGAGVGVGAGVRVSVVGLDAAQQAVVDHEPGRPLCVTGGFGSGKSVALRAAQLRLLGLLLSEVVESQAMDVLAPPDEVAHPTAPPSWLEEALDRIRGGGRLRLFGG